MCDKRTVQGALRALNNQSQVTLTVDWVSSTELRLVVNRRPHTGRQQGLMEQSLILQYLRSLYCPPEQGLVEQSLILGRFTQGLVEKSRLRSNSVAGVCLSSKSSAMITDRCLIT